MLWSHSSLSPSLLLPLLSLSYLFSLLSFSLLSYSSLFLSFSFCISLPFSCSLSLYFHFHLFLSPFFLSLSSFSLPSFTLSFPSIFLSALSLFPSLCLCPHRSTDLNRCRYCEIALFWGKTLLMLISCGGCERLNKFLTQIDSCEVGNGNWTDGRTPWELRRHLRPSIERRL